MRHIQKRALQGQKRFAPANVKPYPTDIYAFAPVGRIPYYPYSQGVALGYALLPLRGDYPYVTFYPGVTPRSAPGYALVGPSARRSGVTLNVG